MAAIPPCAIAAGIAVTEKHLTASARLTLLIIGHSRPHEGRSIEFHRRLRPVHTGAAARRNVSSIVWVDEAENSLAAQRLPRNAAFRQAVQDRSGGRLGEIDILLVPPQGWGLGALRAERG